MRYNFRKNRINRFREKFKMLILDLKIPHLGYFSIKLKNNLFKRNFLQNIYQVQFQKTPMNRFREKFKSDDLGHKMANFPYFGLKLLSPTFHCLSSSITLEKSNELISTKTQKYRF